mmetsp:Transcript_13083/g.33271  ORF Transcript_13083/g.33271 Transcript_13083/m.33271 type:complete len:206 (+) Transcript_13083:915-1532(+)
MCRASGRRISGRPKASRPRSSSPKGHHSRRRHALAVRSGSTPATTFDAGVTWPRGMLSTAGGRVAARQKRARPAATLAARCMLPRCDRVTRRRQLRCQDSATCRRRANSEQISVTPHLTRAARVRVALEAPQVQVAATQRPNPGLRRARGLWLLTTRVSAGRSRMLNLRHAAYESRGCTSSRLTAANAPAHRSALTVLGSLTRLV